MLMVYICTVLIFLLSFAAYMIAAWKHPYFNIGKEESGKNGMLIRNLLSIGALVLYMFAAINVGRFVHTNGFLYITLGYLAGVLLGNLFARAILNRKYKDVVYESYTAKKARESRALREMELAAETAGCIQGDPSEAEPTAAAYFDSEAAEKKEDRILPPAPDHAKAHPWD